MSIETRVVTLSRSFRSLIKTRADLAKAIKDLKDLRALRVPGAIDIKVLKDLREPETFFPQRERWRGTGPRTTGHAEIERSRGTGPRATDPGTISYTEAMRGTGPSRYGARGDREIARDRPSRYGARRRFLMPMQREGQALALRATRRLRDREGQALALRASGTIFYEGLYPIGKNKFDNFGEKWYHFKKLG